MGRNQPLPLDRSPRPAARLAPPGLLSALLAAHAVALGAAPGDTIADRVLGQRDFVHAGRGGIDARGFAAVAAVAVDRSSTPHRLYVLDRGNQRVLGWRDISALRRGQHADLVIGQPDVYSAIDRCFPGSPGAAAGSCLIGGMAVDRQGNLFLSARSGEVLVLASPFTTDTVVDRRIGDPAAACPAASPTTLCEPGDLAVDAAGDLYVVDRGHHRVVVFERVLASDGIADRVLGQVDLASHERGWLPFPVGLEVDGLGRVYVTVESSPTVRVFAPRPGAAAAPDHLLGEPPATAECRDPGPATLCGPTRLAFDDAGGLWVADPRACRLVLLERPLATDAVLDRELAVSGCAPSDPPPWWGPREVVDVAVDGAGRLVVADRLRVLIFVEPRSGDDRADFLLGQVDFAHYEENLVTAADLALPVAVAVDRSVWPNRLYVLDRDHHRVLGFRDAASFRNGSRADLVLGQPDAFTSGCNSGGISARSLCFARNPGYDGNEPSQGLAVDSRGTLYVTDGGNHRVLAFDAPFDTDTVADRVLGQQGRFDRGDCGPPGPSTLCLPGAVSVDPDDDLFVADLANHRVLQFHRPYRDGTRADRVFGQRGSFRTRRCGDGPGELCFGRQQGPPGASFFWGGGLAHDRHGNLYVADFANRRLLLYSEPRRADGEPDRELSAARPEALSCRAPARGLCAPSGLAVDEEGRLWVVDELTGVFRIDQPWRRPRIDLRLSTETPPFPVGSAPTARRLARPSGVAVDALGNLYVADSLHHRVLAFDRPE